MTLFITGGSGFVGGHTIEALSPHHRVLALARSESSRRKVEGYGAEAVMGSLGSVPAAALGACDAIVHCAAFVEEWGTREQFWSANVEGTQQLMDAAREAGVPRFIHIGTEAVLFDGHDLIDVDETEPYPPRQRFLYSETKAEAERRVLAANADTFTTLSLRPRFIWGPRDTSVLPAILRIAEQGGWAWMDGGTHRTSTTHVANLVHAITLALTKGQGGEAYFIADGEGTTLKAFMSRLAATQGVSLPERSIPGAIPRALSHVVEAVWRLLRIPSPPPLSRFSAYMLSSTVTVNTLKAQRELGYAPVLSVDEGMAGLV